MQINILFQAAVLLAFFSLCLSGFRLHAQSNPNPQFEYISVDKGLSENTATAILQDRYGFIWIGTCDGLNRYDGYSFKKYRHDPDDPNSLSYKSIQLIFEDAKGGLWVITNDVTGFPGKAQLNRLDRATGKFERFEYDPDNPDGIGNHNVTCLFEDSKKNLWIGTEGGGIKHFDHQTGRIEAFKFDPEKPFSVNANSIYFIEEDFYGTLWMINKAGLNALDPSTGELKRYRHVPGDPNSLSHYTVYTIFEDSNKTLWIGTNNGLNRLDRKTGCFERFLYDPDRRGESSLSKVEVIFEDARKNLWIGTNNGLYRLDRSTGKFEQFQHDPETPGSICNNWITGIMEGPEGNLWITTKSGIALMDRDNKSFDCFSRGRQITKPISDKSGNIWFGQGESKGLMKMELVSSNIQHFQNNPQNPNSLIDNSVSSILEDSDDNVWVGTLATWHAQSESGGLDRLDRSTGIFEHFRHDPNDNNSIFKNEITFLFEDTNGDLWVSYSEYCLDRLDRMSGKVIKRFCVCAEDSTTIQIHPVFCILEDTEGNIWFGGGNGVNKLDKTSGHFQHFKPFPGKGFLDLWIPNLVQSMIFDSQGYLWAGTLNRGLCRLDPRTGQFEYFDHDPDDPNSLSHNGVLSLHEDAQNNIWVGTGFGLNCFDRSSEKFTRYYEKDGLPNASIHGILEDKDGDLWISTNNGISCFDPERKTFRNFDVHDGLQGNQFNVAACFKSPRSKAFFFGGISGFNIFHPDSLKIDTFAPPVAISAFTYYDHKKSRLIIDDFISAKEKITLSHNDNNLNFEFAALNFRKTAKNQYKYQLEGFSDQWYELGNKREITFNDLIPGNYTLRVMAANGDGVWSRTPAELDIEVLPPWYWSNWSKFSYLLAGAGLLFGFYRFQLNRKLALAEARSLKEMDSVKTRFYTNITHEFRTPLTVIQGMSDQLIEKAGELPKEKIADNARIVKRNSAQLLTMVNQMLDLRRLESGNMPVNLVKGDVLQYFRYLTESFHSYAYDKGVGLHFMTDLEELNMDYDPDKLMHIVSNLLSNAIKFTPEGGNVYFTVERSDPGKEAQDMLTLKIKDTGIGISDDHLPFIFDRFYTSSHMETRKGEGTGIGLALTKELVKLMKGTIEVKSKLHEGTTFSVKLPITAEAAEAAAQPEFLKDKILGLTGPATLKEQKKTILPAENDDLPLALIIEDNPDVVRYLSSCLEHNYQIATALNGKTGVDIALEMIPDIIVSDVMMPEKDGFEVCETLKNDERTSHIPILLLTAKADGPSKLEGFKKGADAYLAKPFNREELQIRLEQLIEQRRKLQEHYSNLGENQVEANVASVEDIFLQKVKQVILDHIGDTEFGQEKLAKALTLSRSQLFRKLKALTGKSTSHVVRSIRLQKAKELLITTDLNVSEVAYDVGFKDLSYFSKCFIEEFGERPSAMRE